MPIFRGQRVTVRIPAVKDFVTGEMHPEEVVHGYVHEPKALCAITRLPGVAVTVDGDGGMYHVRPEWVEGFVQEVRTPLTEASLLEWAKERTVKAPTFTTIENVYTELMLAHDTLSLGDYDARELRLTILDFRRNGTKGYNQMSISELLKEAENRFYGLNSSLDVVDLEELLQMLGMETGEDDA